MVYPRNIVYGAMRELGFDYLRDHLKTATGERVQRALDVVIVDEADHALIDEAFTPLVISGNPSWQHPRTCQGQFRRCRNGTAPAGKSRRIGDSL